MIPFQQNAAFYLKRGAKELERNDLLAAAAKYRAAYLRAPNDEEARLALAEILSQMQRYEESNRILLPMLADPDVCAECHFGLACNFFGMQEYDSAADHLEAYLDLEPDGYYALDAEDFLDLIDDDDAMYDVTGLRTDDDYEDNAVIRFSRALISSGETDFAIEELELRHSAAPTSIKIAEQLALAYFCDQRTADAKRTTNEILSKEPQNVLARCTCALAALEDGRKADAEAELTYLGKLNVEQADELHAIALLQIDLGRYAEAETTLNHILQTAPYDENVLHKLGYVRCMQGNAQGARACYQKLLSIDPEDTVAQYYETQCRHAEGAQKNAARWMIPYQVPFGETFRRLNHINRELARPSAELAEKWRTDRSFLSQIEWAFSLPDVRIKKSMLSLIFSFADEQSERVLREYLLRTDQPDALKRAVFGMLKVLKAEEPYTAYINGRWIDARVGAFSFDEPLPAAYTNIAEILLQYMLGSCSDETISAAAAIFRRYVFSLKGKYPRISQAQELSFAAALEYLGRSACNDTVTIAEVCRAYRVTESRLRNAIEKLQPFVEELK